MFRVQLVLVDRNYCVHYDATASLLYTNETFCSYVLEECQLLNESFQDLMSLPNLKALHLSSMRVEIEKSITNLEKLVVTDTCEDLQLDSLDDIEFDDDGELIWEVDEDGRMLVTSAWRLLKMMPNLSSLSLTKNLVYSFGSQFTKPDKLSAQRIVRTIYLRRQNIALYSMDRDHEVDKHVIKNVMKTKANMPTNKVFEIFTYERSSDLYTLMATTIEAIFHNH